MLEDIRVEVQLTKLIKQHKEVKAKLDQRKWAKKEKAFESITKRMKKLIFLGRIWNKKEAKWFFFLVTMCLKNCKIWSLVEAEVSTISLVNIKWFIQQNQ